MDCSWSDSSVHGILQARTLEWVLCPSPGDLSDPGIEPGSPALQVDSLSIGACLVAQTVKNLPKMQKTRVQYLGQEDPLEKGMGPIPVFLPGEFQGQRSLVGYFPWGHKELDTIE